MIRFLLFGPCYTYRNDTLAVSLWETLESSYGNAFVYDIFCRCMDFISKSQIEHQHCKLQSTNYHSPTLCVIVDLLGFILSSKKCSLQLLNDLSRQSNGYQLISMIGPVLRINKPDNDDAHHANSRTTNSFNRSEASSLSPIYIPGNSDSISVAPSIESPRSTNQNITNRSMSEIDVIQVALKLGCAIIVSNLILCCINITFEDNELHDKNEEDSSPSIKGLLHKTLREFITYSSISGVDSMVDSKIIDIALLQTRSKDLTNRALSLHGIISQIYDDEYNFGEKLFESYSAVVKSASTNESNKKDLIAKCDELSEKVCVLERDIIFSKSISEKERIRAVEHARVDAMELIESHLDARRESEQRSQHYKEKLRLTLSELETAKETIVSIRQNANECIAEKDQLVKEVTTKESLIKQLEAKINELSSQLSRNQIEMKTLVEQSRQTEEKCNKLNSKKSELQNENEDLYNTKEDAYFKLIALAQIFEQKQEEASSTKQDLLDELRSSDEAKQSLQKKYDRLKEKTISFQEENDLLKRKLEKTMRKLNEASQRRPIGPVAYINKLHSDPKDSQRYESQRLHGKENDYSFASSRRTTAGRKSNFRIVK